MRCHSWRYVPHSNHSVDHLPGYCRRCWHPCFRQVDDGFPRCEQCYFELAQHPNDVVRRMLAAEEDLPENVARFLMSDFNAMVVAYAGKHLEDTPELAPVTIGPNLHQNGGSPEHTTALESDW